jgi:drug/metabolite transporter (DMT)-like permease
MARPSALHPSVYLVLASFFWAVGTVLSKQLLASIPPIMFLAMQLAPSVLLLWLLVLAKRVQFVSRSQLAAVILLGLLNPGLAYTLSMLGLAQTTASVATLVWAAEPALIVALSWLVLRELLTVPLAILTCTAACGVILASGSVDLEMLRSENAYGTGLILSGVICCALYTVWSRKIMAEVKPLSIVAIQQAAGLAWAFAILPFDLVKGDVPKFSKTEIIGCVVSGLMYYALAYWLYLKGLQSMPASKAGSFLNLIPVFGVTLAYAFLGERLAPSQWMGAAIILVSVFVLQRYATVPSAAVLKERGEPLR